MPFAGAFRRARAIIITNPAAPAPNASTAICRQQPTWSSMRGATTASGFRVPICRFHSARRTRASQCHADRPVQWAAETVASWYPVGRQTTPHYGTALHAGRVGAADAEQRLDRLILDQGQPAIVRASALPLLRAVRNSGLGAGDKHGDHRYEPARRLARRGLPAAAPPAIAKALAPLSDPVRAVRVETARALAGTDLLALTSPQQRYGVGRGDNGRM